MFSHPEQAPGHLDEINSKKSCHSLLAPWKTGKKGVEYVKKMEEIQNQTAIIKTEIEQKMHKKGK
jgi:hypothetical protein